MTIGATGAAGRHVILGGMGNLGLHLQKILAGQGKYVVVLDRPIKNNPLAERRLAQVQRRYGEDTVSYRPFTLGYDSADDLAKILHEHNAETVYSVVTPDVQHGTVSDFERTNVTGIHDLVDACRRAAVPKLVYASSMAVTNHFTDSINEDEGVPLPPIDSYETCYDRTKRLGEDIVLGASSSSSDHDGHQLATVALRLGAILCSYNGYSLRQCFQDGSRKGTIMTTNTKPFDFIAGSDIASAMSKADEKLSSTSTASTIDGKALYCTKARDADTDTTMTARRIAEYIAMKMGWTVQVVPSQVLTAVQHLAHLQHLVATPFRTPGTEPGMPMYKFLQIINYQQTFDNSLIHRSLDWKPELTVWEALDVIIEDFERDQQSSTRS